MKMTGMRIGMVSLFSALASPGSHAETLRCGNDLAQIGDSKAAILTKCGEPMSRDSSCKPLAAGAARVGTDHRGAPINVIPCETVDDWTYNPGSGQFYTTLRFVQGKLISMTYGGRVP